MYIYYLLSVCTSFEKHKITKESVSINSYQTYVGFIRAGLLVFDMFYARTEQVKIVTRYLRFCTSSWSCRVFTGVTLVAPQHFSFTSAVTSECTYRIVVVHKSFLKCKLSLRDGGRSRRYLIFSINGSVTRQPSQAHPQQIMASQNGSHSISSSSTMM